MSELSERVAARFKAAGKPWERGKSLEELGERGSVYVYRAFPLEADSIRPGDYITLKWKFAKEHAVTSAVYREEPFQVGAAFVDAAHIVGATNRGEYTYEGDREVKVKTRLIATPDGQTEKP